jgi:hypothetical protein
MEAHNNTDFRLTAFLAFARPLGVVTSSSSVNLITEHPLEALEGRPNTDSGPQQNSTMVLPLVTSAGEADISALTAFRDLCAELSTARPHISCTRTCEMFSSTFGHFGTFLKCLVKHVRTHVVRPTMDELDLFPDDRFMEELDINPMSARHVPHCWVFTRGDHTYRCGVVLHKFHGHGFATELFP